MRRFFHSINSISFALALIFSSSPIWSQSQAETTTFYSIQIGAFTNPRNALQLVEKLRDSGYGAFYRTEVLKGSAEWFMVFLDQYHTREEAAMAAKKMKKEGVIEDYQIRIIYAPASDDPFDPFRPPFSPKTTKLDNLSRTGADQNEIAKLDKRGVQSKDRSDTPLVVNNITFKLEKGPKEIVIIHFNRIPSHTVFALEGIRPRSVVDIKEVDNIRKGLTKIPVNGALIKQIRSHLHRDSNRLRVVLDHYPLKNYRVDRIYYKSDKAYCQRSFKSEPFSVVKTEPLCPVF